MHKDQIISTILTPYTTEDYTVNSWEIDDYTSNPWI